VGCRLTPRRRAAKGNADDCNGTAAGQASLPGVLKKWRVRNSGHGFIRPGPFWHSWHMEHSLYSQSRLRGVQGQDLGGVPWPKNRVRYG
jgi:hypothetical protein